MPKKLKTLELNRISIEAFKAADKTPIVVLLDDVRSALNVGSVFRTSDAFRIEQVALCGITAAPPHRDIRRTALGATDSVEWTHNASATEVLEQYRTDGYKILAIEQAEDSVALNDFIPQENEKYVLVFGNEVEGVKQEIVDFADAVIEIPQYGTKHSFNISVSAGIVLWDVFSKLK